MDKIESSSKTLTLKISPLQVYFSVKENETIYWNVYECLPGDVFIRGNLAEGGKIEFPIYINSTKYNKCIKFEKVE